MKKMTENLKISRAFQSKETIQNMKTGKEYPATHSMSTSWYIVDEEGNVGLMDYEDNGPVPWALEENYCDGLIYGHIEDKDNTRFRFNLTDEQIFDTIRNPHVPCDEENWYTCVVKINKEKEERFLKLCSRIDVYCLCISDNLGLYLFRASHCVKRYKNKKSVIGGTLRKILDEEIILEVYDMQDYFIDVDYVDDKPVYTKSFDKSPYFMFHQPYDTDDLPQKVYEPEHPVTIDQIPKEFRCRLHRIPGDFRKLETFQIAQYYPCETNGNNDPSYLIDGCIYHSSPLPDGTRVYAKSSMCEYDFLPFCPEKEHYHCEQECSDLCCEIADRQLADNPTVLIIYDPREELWNVTTIRTDYVMQHSFITPYISRYPYQNGKRLYKLDVFKLMTHENLSALFAKTKGYLETIIEDVKPRVILATEKAYQILADNYTVDSSRITIDGADYPFYPFNSLEENRVVIDQLAHQPYRGKVHPLVISVDEMERLINDEAAKRL